MMTSDVNRCSEIEIVHMACSCSLMVLELS
jgi:hypothetical protein